MDEYHPGSFRQAQVSFSTRIPSAFPLGDSLSMSTTVSLYNTAMCIKHLVKEVIKEKDYSRNGGASPTLPVVKEEGEDKEELEVLIIVDNATVTLSYFFRNLNIARRRKRHHL